MQIRFQHIFLLSAFCLQLLLNGSSLPPADHENGNNPGHALRERISINEGWRFMRYAGEPDSLIYDVRPDVNDRNDNVVADTKPTEAVSISSSRFVLKPWILP